MLWTNHCSRQKAYPPQKEDHDDPPEEVIAIIDTLYPHFKGTELGEDLNQLKAAITGGSSTGIFLRDVSINLGSQIAA